MGHKWSGRVPNFPHFRIDEENPCDDQITNSSFVLVDFSFELTVNPNPTTNHIYFSFSQVIKEKSTLSIYNSMGLLEKEVPIKEYQLSKNVDVTSLTSGVYHYNLSSLRKQFASGSFVKI